MKKEEKKQLDDILKAHDYNKTSVIAIMQDIQKIYHYLPQEVLTYIAGELGLSEAKVYGVATFYENFSLEGVSQEHPTTEDMMFTVETVSCLGACGLAPVCTVNDKVHPAMTPEKARALIEELKEEAANEN